MNNHSPEVNSRSPSHHSATAYHGEEFNGPEVTLLLPSNAVLHSNVPQRRVHPSRSPQKWSAVEDRPSTSSSPSSTSPLLEREPSTDYSRITVSNTPRERIQPQLLSSEYSKEKGKVKSKEKLKQEKAKDTSSDVDDVEKGTKGGFVSSVMPGSRGKALVSGLAYCLSSCSMILLNKLVLSSFKWEAQISLMLYQNLVSVIIVSLLSKGGIVTTEAFSWKLARLWLPVNIVFVGMLVTSFFSLKYMQVAMVMVLKNMTNLVTALGEMYIFRKRHSLRVWGSLLLMVISALCGGITDLSFHPIGYTWQLFNCLFTAAYSLTLRRVMDKAKATTRSGHLSEFSMVLLNNTLSLPLAFVLVLLFGEIHYLTSTPLVKDPYFWLAATSSGLLGLAISFTSMWFLHQTSPTTYSLVGSLNKIPLSIAGIVLFRAPTSVANLGSILFGCFAGILFARAKLAS